MLNHGLIPYDKEGRRSERAFSCLDLTKGNRIKLHSNHNSQVWVPQCPTVSRSLKLVIMQGSQQASRQKLDVDCEGVVLGYCHVQRAWKLEIQGVKMLLGHWWISV